MNLKPAFFFVLIAFCTAHASAAIIGTNIPSSPLTIERINALPADQQAVWKNYLERSQHQMQADRDFLSGEMKAHGVKTSIKPPSSNSAKSIPLENPADWYGGTEARRVADIIVSFQTPAGGWSKNLNMAKHVRAPGEAFAIDNIPAKLGAADNDTPRDAGWSYVGTIDNDATTTQLRFLAKVISTSKTENGAWRKSFLHGLDYLFAAQYPNGGWPQVWPLQGGYHDAITLNDDAMLNVLELLHAVAGGQNEFSFVPAEVRAQAAASFRRGMDCVLAAQISVNGRRTAWCQQYDALTLQPASARNYEMPSESSSESASLVLFLMQLPDPNSAEIAAVRAAAAWFGKTKIEGKAYKPVSGKGRELIDAPGSVVWSRYYEIGTDRPIYGDRDKTIHDDISEISKERRNGYGWFRDTPKRLLEHFPRWSAEHP